MASPLAALSEHGLPAIRSSIAAGINVNVTLIFSIGRYRQVVEAYQTGLEDEGVEKFADSYTAVLETVEAKRLAALA